MAQRNNILDELQELKSSLANTSVVNPYQVPHGYFEGIVAAVLSRIKAMEADSAGEELSHLSELLSGVSKTMPFTLPDGYFEELGAGSINQSLNLEDELKDAPVLRSVGKVMPYEVPAGYFDKLAERSNRTHKQTAKIISLSSKWVRYAAAAVIIAAISVTSFLIGSRNSDPKWALENLENKITKEIKKTSDQELSEFLKYTEGEQSLALNQPKAEVKALLKDVAANDLQSFLDEIADPELSTDETSSME